MEKYENEFKKMIEFRGLTDNTLKSYISYLKEFFAYVESNRIDDIEKITWGEVRDYVLFLKNTKKLNPRTINAHISQLRFLFVYVFRRPWDHYQVPHLKFDSYLPFVLSQKDTRRFIDTLENIKHKAIVALLYSAGLRVSEACNLKYGDISRANMNIYIRRTKNRSDRYANLSKKALAILTEYWVTCGKPKDWLFPSPQKSGKPVVSFTVLRFIKDHEKRLGWEPRINCHTFRHCFGRHLYENGADLVTVSKAMGHKSLSSTLVYLRYGHCAYSPSLSPFDKEL